MPRPKLKREYRDEPVMVGYRVTRNIEACMVWIAKRKTLDSADKDGYEMVKPGDAFQQIILKEFNAMRKKHGLGALTDAEVKELSKQKSRT